MIHKEDGAAGFFEDLPVLMFVLAGASALVMSATWVHRVNVEQEAETEMGDAARRLAESVVASFRSYWGAVPRVTSIQSKNLSTVVAAQPSWSGCVVTVAALHPNNLVLAAYSEDDLGDVLRTGYSRILFNAVDDHGLILILEVRAIVWQVR